MDLEFAGQMIEQYGYLAVFLSTVIEGEVVVLAAAVMSAGGLLEAHWVIAAAALGAFVGHILLFGVGRWKGMQLIESVPLLRQHYPKANMVMDKYANWSVFVFQYLYGTRLISAVLFGCSTINFGRFLLLQIINCIIWASLAFFAGHVIGIVAFKLFDMVGIYGLMLIVALLAMAVLLLYHRFGHHHVKGFFSGGRGGEGEQMNAIEGRHFTIEQLEYHMQLAARTDKPLSMLFIKLPGSGRGAPGNRLEVRLSLTSHELCRLLRLTDIPARFGRDIFAVVAPNTDAAGARQAVSRLLTEMSREHIVDTPLLIGIAEWQPGMSSGKVLDLAYRDLKASGKSSAKSGFDVEAKAQ